MEGYLFTAPYFKQCKKGDISSLSLSFLDDVLYIYSTYVFFSPLCVYLLVNYILWKLVKAY